MEFNVAPSPRSTLPSPRERVSTPGEKRKATPVDPRSAKEPRGSSNTTEQEKREKVAKLIKDALSVRETNADEEDAQLVRQRANQVEDALHSFCLGNMQEYTEKAKTLKFNIEKNKELRDEILSQAIRADDLVAMKSAELADRAKKSMRETAKAESLQETINNDELKNLKDMAAGLSMRKTDAGLAVVDPDAEKAKKEQEELERRKLEEERIRAAAVALEKQQKTLVKVDMGDENAYLTSNWEYTPKVKDGNEDSSDDEDGKVNKTELLIASPLLGSQELGSQDMAALDNDQDEQDEQGQGTAMVWQGELDYGGRKVPLLHQAHSGEQPLQLTAFPLQEEGELHNNIFPKLQVRGYIGLGEMEKYIELKRKTPDVKMVLAFKLVPRASSRSQYDALVLDLDSRNKGMCIIDDGKWGGLLYCLPSSSPSVRSLLPFGEDQSLIAVAVTNRNKQAPVPKYQQADEINLSNNAVKPSAHASSEKIVSLSFLKKKSCNLLLRAIAGDVELDHIPQSLKDVTKVSVEDMITFLLTQKVSVMEVEPESAKDQEEYQSLLDYMLEKRRSLVVLDTEKALMYLVPPVDEAGKLLDPPCTTCDSMLAVLVLGQSTGSSVSALDTFVHNQENAAIATVPVPVQESRQSDDGIAERSNFAQNQMPHSQTGVDSSAQSAVASHAQSAVASHAQSAVASHSQSAVASHSGRYMRHPQNYHQPLNVETRDLRVAGLAVHQGQLPFDPSPRPLYDSQVSPSLPAPRPTPSMPAPGPPPRGNVEAWREDVERGREGVMGWNDGYQAPFLGARPDDWQHRNDHHIRNDGNLESSWPHSNSLYGMRQGESLYGMRQGEERNSSYQGEQRSSSYNHAYDSPQRGHHSYDGGAVAQGQGGQIRGHVGGHVGGQLRGHLPGHPSNLPNQSPLNNNQWGMRSNQGQISRNGRHFR